MLRYLTEKKDLVHQNFGKFYFKYGCFCSTRPIFMIGFSCVVVILCSLPLTSFPIFEKIIAFLFQRIRVSYNTKVSSTNDVRNSTIFGYIQQVNLNATVHGYTDLTKEDIVDNLLRTNEVYNFERKLREAVGPWNNSCMKLQRDPPSMKALKKRIKFSHSIIHGDLKMRRIYLLKCLYISPNFLFDNGRMVHPDDYSVAFQELSLGYPVRYYKGTFEEGSNVSNHISVMFTLFLKEKSEEFHKTLLQDFQRSGLKVDTTSNLSKSYQIHYQFSDDSSPAELLPLGLAYLVVFLYLWFSVAKLDFIRTRWGLAFAAVMNFVASFVMAIGICAFFDALPTTLNVGEIFPYVVILIGMENFWIITKSVMTTKKDLPSKERVGIGLGLEGWYITKNLLVEISLLGTGYLSGVKGIQEFSVFALACYLSDFFLQMAFFTPILAVDIRRAEVGLPFSNRSAWKYALYIDLEKPEGSKKVNEKPRQKYSAAVRLAFSLARYRVLQRSVMVFIIGYFLFTVSHPLQEIVNPANAGTSKELHMSGQDLSNHMSCWNDRDSLHKSTITSWLFLCNKHWPELLNYYFEHLNQKSLVILPQINLRTTLKADALVQPIYAHKDTLFQGMLGLVKESSKPMVAICVIIFLTALYKLVYFIQVIIKQLGGDEDDVYACESHVLNVPTSKAFPFKVTKMVVDEADVLVSAYVNGSVYVWDLYSDTCSYYINRRAKRVYNLAISRSMSTHSLPTPEDSHMKFEQSKQELPRAVWSIAYKSDVLIIGCAKGAVEVYSLENECLQCFHQSDNESGVVSVQIISCLRFVIAHKSGIVEFCHIKNARSGRKRANSLPNDDPAHVERELEVSRIVIVSYQPILWMEIALNKVFVASDQGQVKVLRARDDGGIPLQCHVPRDQEITFLRTEMSPEMALVGTSTGNVYVVNAVGQLEKILYCGDDEVMSIASNDDYIAVHCYDGCTTVWLKEGYIKWWQLNMISYGAVYEILSLARYSLAAVTKENVILLSIVTRSVVGCVRYESSPNFGLIMASPVVCQNKSSIVVPSASSIVHLKFPKLIDHDR